MDKARQAELRYRARTDLFWLATEILGYTDLVPRVHQPVCNHFYKIVPGTPIKDVEIGNEQKGMSLYDPRAHFKTTIMIASAVQWLINFPNIRLFLGAGKLDRAADSLVAVKNHFQHNAKLRRLFPEFCPNETGDWGTTTEFTLPNRTAVLVDPSCLAFSLDSIKAGPHCDVMFIDDAVHEGNVGNPEQLLVTIKRFIFMRSILEPYGYMHVIGTPYSDADLYQWLEEDNNGDWLRKFRRPAWKLNDPDFPDGRKITEADVTLLFPERFSFKFFKSIRDNDEYIFNCQYLLDPTPKDQITFTDTLLERHHIPHAHIPRTGSVFQAWDIGFKDKKRNDFTVGATGLFDSKGNLFILDIVVGRFNPYVLVQQIAMAAIKWRPNRVAIEDAGGTQLMLPALDNLQRQYQRSFGIEWVPTSPLKQKPERILSLQPLLLQDKLYFSANIKPDEWKELKKQFTKYPRTTHDDVPDAISMLLFFRGRIDYTPDAVQGQDEDITSVSWDSDSDNLLGAGIIG